MNNLEQVRISEKEMKSNKIVCGDTLFERYSVNKERAGYPAIFPGTDEIVVFCRFIIRKRLHNTQVLPAEIMAEVWGGFIFRIWT